MKSPRKPRPQLKPWVCGMCGFISPARCTKRCKRCSAERGMGAK